MHPMHSAPGAWLALSLCLATALTGCRAPAGPDAGCVGCHRGLELVSPTHPGCVPCHGGDGAATEEKAAHRGMLGPKNPSDPKHWEATCGACHAQQLQRVRSSLMVTNAGIIKNIQETWDGVDGRRYGVAPLDGFGADGAPVRLEGVAELDNLAGELYRKFCALCHVGIEDNVSYRGTHAAGCAACHFPYDDTGTYQGGDPTVKGKHPYSETHAMAALPDNRVCFRCHNRSGRIALSYQGLYDGNNGVVPTQGGQPGPTMISGARNAIRIAPDVHHQKGLECIDCHTSRDLMGDGYAYENLYQQVEIACEDCHGSATERPRTEVLTREHGDPLRESRSYPRPVTLGTELLLTTKGRPYSNAFVEGGKVWVQGKRSGKLHESRVITGTPEHGIVGHERLACHTCHSRAVPQCYGCHTRYDQALTAMDWIKGYPTPGAFSETEDYRMAYPFPLALDQRGKVVPVTPGCQTFVTVTDPEGRPVQQGYVARYKGKNQLRFAPFYSHNTGVKAVGCAECHGNPAFLGFGQHAAAGDELAPTLLCERSGERPLDGFVTLEGGRVRPFSAITREGSRALDDAEVKRVWRVNLCLACHQDPKDPIYQRKLDYGKLEECLRRGRLASSRDPRTGG